MRSTGTPQSNQISSNWPAYVGCAIAFAALAFAILFQFNPYVRESAGSDFKTLYASTYCFVHGVDGYQFPNIANVFHQNGVVEPRSWYGHSPVYPPLTLAMLAPVTMLRMVPAINAWILLGCVTMAFATAVLVRTAGNRFGLNLPLKIVLVALSASSPLLEIGLELANVSVVSAALCILAVALPASSPTWIRALALVIAALLKPHIALWIIVAFLFSRLQQDRRVLLYAAAALAGFVVLYSAWGAVHHFAFTQFQSYRDIVASELNNGSMSPGNHDLMEVFVQITSLSSLLGYYLWQHPAATILGDALLLVSGVLLVWSCVRARKNSESQLIEFAAAWSAFGLMATYHRNADAMILVLAIPALLARLRTNLNDMWAWLVLGLLVVASVGPSISSLHTLLDGFPATSIYRFVLLRQASISILLLVMLLTGKLWVDRAHDDCT